MDFYEVLDQIIDLLRQRGRASYQALKRQFDVDDACFQDLKVELIEVLELATDRDGKMLEWSGGPGPVTPAAATDAASPPIAHTPPYLAEKILTSRSAMEGERKHVTVLFADIKDSTELIHELDPEEAQKHLDPAIYIMMEAVHRFEGTVNQVLGDGIMSIFGAPIAHEDHAARACYAALEMQKAMQPYADDMFRAHGITMQIRVGLHSGEVVVRTIGNDLHMDYSAVGHTTNLAARMEKLATPGRIALTGATLRLVEGMIQVKSRGPVPVKGMPEPVAVYELMGASSIKRRLQATLARGLTTFVGREREIETLHDARDRAATGRGQLLAVVGEAGVGKSRLAYEFTHDHRTQGWLVLESASVSYGKATPYLPVVDLLKRYVHVEDGDAPRTIRAKVTGQVLTLDDTLQDAIPPLLALLDVLPEDHPFFQLDPLQRRQRTFEALKRILLRESQVQPLLLVFEDLHWSDTETQALLDSMVASLPTAQLLLLVNYRPEFQHRWGRNSFYTQVQLDPLPPMSATALLAALLGEDPGLSALTERLIERTQGNPFFLEEIVRTLVESQVLAGEPGAYRLARTVTTLDVPATVQAVLAARIDRLPAAEKRLLQTAAVIGSEVPLPLLQAVAELDEAVLHRSLAHLQAADFLYETQLFPSHTYTFKHALTQNVAYHTLLTRTRQQSHQQIAEVLTSQFPEAMATQPERVAHHYTEAGLHAQAVGYWHQAGQRAMERSAHAESVTLFSSGLDLLSTQADTPERLQQELELLISLGSALLVTKGVAAAEVEQTYIRAWEICQQVEAGSQLLRVMHGLVAIYTGQGALQKALDVGEQCLTLAERQRDAASLIAAHGDVGATLFFMGAFVSARVHLEQGGLNHLDAEPHRHASLEVIGTNIRRLQNRSYMALVFWYLGYPDEALRWGRETLALARKLSRPFTLATALHYMAICHACRREWEAVYEHAEAVIAQGTEAGFPQWVSSGMILKGEAMVEMGRVETGIAQMHEGLTAHQESSAELARPIHLCSLARAYWRAGDAAKGLAILAEGLEVVETSGARTAESELYRLQGELLRHADDSTPMAALTPEACFQKALEIARRQQAKSLELRAATSLAKWWQAQDRCQDAYELLTPVYEWFREGFGTEDLSEAKRFLNTLKTDMSPPPRN